MKWLVLLLVVACGADKSSGNKSPAVTPTPEQEEQRPVPSEPQAPVSRCADFALPAYHVRNIDFLSFPNFGYRGVGRCRGHAVLTQKLLMLMRFNPSASFDCDTDIYACKAQVREWLNRVENGESVVVPGFSTLAELSAHPAIEPVLRGRIISYGSRYSAIRLPLPGSAPRSINVFNEVKRRVKLHHLPYVALLGPKVGNHGVLAYGFAIREGQKVMCVRDPNIVPERNEDCDNYLVRSGEAIRYVRHQRSEDTVQLEITNDEDTRSALYRRALCR